MRKFMGKLLVAVLALLLAPAAFCQAFDYPSFNNSIKAIDDLLLSNWILKDSATGDLNGDNLPDLVTVVQWKDTIEELRPDNTVNLGSPRILLIFFKNSKTGDYDLVLQHNTFIIRYGEGGMDPEAYGKVSIKNKIVDIFYSLLRGQAEYKIRYQQNDFYLIGATTGGESGGQIDYWDINFLTKKAKHEWGDISDEKLKSKWVNVPVQKLKKLKELPMQFSWEVMPYVFI
ncbi:MAG TPA: hypothetical protein VGQ53_00925 [Chitinophagaceae bacterium]|jgi:hypothetical protein|nr:hypothetical protein [Chitinophagaceae bacterium]